MSDYEEIIKLRNKGYTQEEVSKAIGISTRTVIRYLSSGKIPVYKRSKSTKEDPFIPFKERAEEIIRKGVDGKVPQVSDVYRTIKKEGYKGSERTLERKTLELRKSLENKELYFEQEVNYGEMIEGDFTGLDVPYIDGIRKKHLWVMSSKKTKKAFVASFGNETFESFAEGTSKGFEYFGGIPKIYRLDNFKAAVKKILRTSRSLTVKFNSLRKHYGFMPSFCRPAKGNDKGTVETTNKHFKNHLKYEFEIDKVCFRSEEDFENYLYKKLKEFNSKKEEEGLKEKEYFSSLPREPFPAFSTVITNVNKYGFVRHAGRRYSVPDEFKYRQVELRVFSKKIEIFSSGKKIKEHNRQTHNNVGRPILDFKDHVGSMLKKPGAFTHYKHKEFFFPTEVFTELYTKNPKNKKYLKVLSMCKSNSISTVEKVINLVVNESELPDYDRIIDLLEPKENIINIINSIKPLIPSLDGYNNLLNN